MGVVIDLVHKKFGKLSVISQVAKRGKNREVFWNCKCECGNDIVVTGCHLKSGHTTSCGCYAIEKLVGRSTKHGDNKRGNRSGEYRTWVGIRYRCYNKNCPEYSNYGGRGIRVCDSWLNSFDNFIKDMGRKPTKAHSLDRWPNVNGDYEPNNCRWATPKQQAGNKRNNRWIRYNGENMILADWAIRFGTTPSTLFRMLKNKSFDEVFVFYSNKNSLK